MPIADKNSECMYTEEEMKKRINKLRPALTAMGGFDVLVTHALLGITVTEKIFRIKALNVLKDC